MIINKASRVSEVKAYYFATKLQEVAAMNMDGSVPVINLGIGSPDLQPPPEVISTLHTAADDPKANKYQSYKGTSQLREAFANWYQKWFGVTLGSDTDILPLMGSKEGIMHISMSFLQSGDRVLVPNPGYPAYRMCAALAGATTIPYELSADKKWLPDLDKISQLPDFHKVKIMWINYPHMPTGAVADLVFYKELVKWAKKHEILICSDNPYAFILNESPASPLQVEGALAVCIELTSLSKCYNMAGWRVGCLAGSKDYIDTVLTYKSNMDSGMYRPIQEAAVAAMNQKADWFEKINATYRQRKQIAMEIMNLLELEYDASAAGMFIWGRLSHDLFTSAEVIDDILHGARVFLTPGHIFGTAGEGYIRISLCATVDELLQAKQRIANHLKHLA